MRSITLAALLLLGSGCAEPPPEPDRPRVPGELQTAGPVVMTVDDQTLTQPMLRAVEKGLPPAELAVMKAKGEHDAFVEGLAVRQVLYQRGLAQQLQDRPEVRTALAMAEREVLAAAVLRSVQDAAVTDDAVTAAYKAGMVEYARPQVHVRHILVPREDVAKDLAKQLRKGADFAALARQHSTDHSKDLGGDLGWREKQRLLPEIAEVAFGLEKGGISDPIETRYGYHVLAIVDTRDSTPLAEVRPVIEADLRAKALEAYMSDLRKEVVITRPTPEPSEKKKK